MQHVIHYATCAFSTENYITTQALRRFYVTYYSLHKVSLKTYFTGV